MSDVVGPEPGEVALWGTLQSGARVGVPPEPSGWVMDRDGVIRLSGGIVTVVGFVAFALGLADVGRLADLVGWGHLASGLAMIIGFAVFTGVMNVGRSPSGKEATRTAWFVSRDRLVVSTLDGRGEAIPLKSIRSVTMTFAEGSPAVEVQTDAQRLLVLAADAEGLRRVLDGLVRAGR